MHVYEQWGKASFDRFNGVFGLALYERNARQGVLARDHFGIKPLYYSQLPSGKLVFASEIKFLLHSTLVVKKPNDRIIYRYLNYRVHDDLFRVWLFSCFASLMQKRMTHVASQCHRVFLSDLSSFSLSNKMNTMCSCLTAEASSRIFTEQGKPCSPVLAYLSKGKEGDSITNANYSCCEQMCQVGITVPEASGTAFITGPRSSLPNTHCPMTR